MKSYPWTAAELILVPLGFLLLALVVYLFGPQMQDAVRALAEHLGFRAFA